MSISSLINQMLTLLIFLIVGVVAYKTKVIDENGNKVFTKVTLNIFQPAMILSAVMRTELSYSLGELVIMLLCTVAAYVIMIGAAYIFAPLFVRKKDDRGVFRFLLCFGNVGFMGLPLLQTLFGQEGAFYAAIGIVVFNLLIWTHGTAMMNKQKNKFSVNALVNPGMVGFVVGFIF